ncbi:MAG: DUF5131 family protein [Rhizobiaceae bacterium]
MAETTIEWTATRTRGGGMLPGYTFNPWEGCQKVSPACDHCYAETRNIRFSAGANWGPKAPRRRTSAANWKKPYKWDLDAYRKKHRRKVFCASLADVFDTHHSIPPEWHADLWDMIRGTMRLDWLLLTKRPQNIFKTLPSATGGYGQWGKKGYRNVWLGTTAENRVEMIRRGTALKKVPARCHFWSCEPLLEDLGDIPPEIMPDWIIAGGESGSGCRSTDLAWFRNLRDQCAAANVPFFMKQMGGTRKPFPPIPDDLMVRQFPAPYSQRRGGIY